MPTLNIQLPGLPPVSHVLREETTTIGRMKGSTIVLDDTSVSLMHAKITRNKEGEYFLKDLNSTNGTLVNGQNAREVKLQDLDQICFADVIAQFHGETAPAAAQPIVPLMPAPAAKASGVPQLLPAKAPAAAPSAPVSEGTVRLRRSSHSPPGTWLTRLADRAVPILGGVAALVVVGIVVWKLFLSGGKQKDTAENNPPAAVAKNNPDTAANATTATAPPAKSTPPKTVPKPPMPPKNENAHITRLVAGLKDADAEERRRAARALHSIGPEANEANAALKNALKDSDEEVQMWAALTLVNNKSYDKPAIPILVRALHHENATLRQVACLSLAIIPYEAAEKDSVVPALAAAAANDDDEEVRKAAYSALTIIAPDIVAKANEK